MEAHGNKFKFLLIVKSSIKHEFMVEAEAWQLYELMLRSRRFEEATKKL